MHVERHLPPLLELLLLRGAVVVPQRHALRQNLSDPAAGVKLRQAVVGIRNQPLPEGAQSNLGHRPVEEDLGRNVHVVDRVLQVGHQQQVPRRVKVVVDRLVEDVTQHGPGLCPLVRILVDEEDKVLDQLEEVLLHREVRGQLHGRLVLDAHVLLVAEDLGLGLRTRRGGVLGLGLRLLGGRSIGVLGLLLLDVHEHPHGVVHSLGLRVVVLQLPQGDPGHHRLLVLPGKVLGDLLSHGQDHGLVLEPVEVVLGVRVDDLQRLEPLVVQALQAANQVARDRDGVALSGALLLLRVVLLKGVLHGNVRKLLQQVQQSQNRLAGAVPHGDGQVRPQRPAHVEVG
mmetsp:Transcript_31352/g.67596  ORF Transcript_31352/g.67596 Transcript_31352/m.67596 type:complete len:342 (-) Transcript_31352:988-2013(-)